MYVYYCAEMHFVVLLHKHVPLCFRKLNGNSLTTLKEGTFHGLKMLKQL